MASMISMCGLDCSQCPAYIATQTDDNELRIKTAAEWSQAFHADLKPEHIVCDGCVSASPRKFAHCYQCEMRKCGTERKLANCAHCGDYACDKLTNLFNMVPMAKANLDQIRSTL